MCLGTTRVQEEVLWVEEKEQVPGTCVGEGMHYILVYQEVFVGHLP